MTTARILQLSDLHVFRDAETTLKGIPTRTLLIDVVRHALQSGMHFNHVIVTGDHTHDEQLESYQAVRNILTPWHDRLRLIPGNHDDRGLLRNAFADRINGCDAEPIRFAFSAGCWLCLGLDTHVPGAVAGFMDQEQVDWIAGQLAASDGRHVALFMHHPPVDVGSLWMDPIGLTGRERLWSLVKREPRIKLICCGHVHHEFRGRLGAAEVLTTPATGIQFSPIGSTPTMAADAPGYRVIELSDDGYSSRVECLLEIRFTPTVE